MAFGQLIEHHFLTKLHSQFHLLEGLEREGGEEGFLGMGRVGGVSVSFIEKLKISWSENQIGQKSFEGEIKIDRNIC